MVVSRLAFFRGMLVRGFPPPYRGTGHAFDRGNDELVGRFDECGGGVIQAHSTPFKHQFRTNRSSRLSPAHQGMKSWSPRVGTANWHSSVIATPLESVPADPFKPSRLAKSSTALQGRGGKASKAHWSYDSAGFVGWRAGTSRYENWQGTHTPLDSGVVPGIGVCFRTGIAHAGWCRHTKVRKLVVSAVDTLSRNVSAWIPAFARMLECTGFSVGVLNSRSLRIFVPIAHPGWRRHTKV